MHGLVEHVPGGAKVAGYVNWMIGGERRWNDMREVGGRARSG